MFVEFGVHEGFKSRAKPIGMEAGVMEATLQGNDDLLTVFLGR